MKVYNSFFPKEWVDIANELIDNTGFRFGWKANNSTTYDNGHWNLKIASQPNKYSRVDVSKTENFEKNEVFAAMWEDIQKEIGRRKLVRCYANGYTYGTDGFAHRDDFTLYKACPEYLKTSETLILYLNEKWHYDWAGETVFYSSDGEINYSLLPAFNRLVSFDSTILHAARPVSRACPVLRKVLVFKTSDYTVDGLENKWEYVMMKSASQEHSNSNFFNHLKNVYELLVQMKQPDYICDAGLYHSIYGTSYFSSESSEYVSEDRVKTLIGDKAESLVKMFCTLNPRTQEIFNMSKSDTKKELLIIEFANLYEQIDRKPEYRSSLNAVIEKLNNEFNYNAIEALK